MFSSVGRPPLPGQLSSLLTLHCSYHVGPSLNCSNLMKGNTILSSSKTTASIQPDRFVLRGLQYFLGNHLPELFFLLFEWGAGISVALQKKNWHLGGKWDVSLPSSRVYHKRGGQHNQDTSTGGREGFSWFRKYVSLLDWTENRQTQKLIEKQKLCEKY